MAKKAAVWGIDIGNSSLKALRCREADEPGKIEALAFDFIEHSKILSQPGAEPGEILAESLQTFLSRNSTKGDRVAISVSGQNTISRFLKLPPVDPKKVPDIIKYEAKQWLPFDLDDVIWDFQPIGLANQSDTAVPLDSEIGMFAMKRDIAMKTLAPFQADGIDVDSIQSSPLAVYNFAAFDQLGIQDIEEYDPDNPPESLVVLCVGTDATDVVITNGFSIWIRSIPIGGNVFTKALAKGLKLTSSKAEYLKRNAANAQDPKAVFQAMRPVFNDMLSEVHRSLEYYQGINRKARFSKILALGNAMKMPGLRQFLTQNLGYEVVRLAHFNRLVGPEVTEAPLFKENLYSFGVSYGLALQQLGEASLTTNLIPKEIVTDRIVREKKPWALAGAAAVLLGLALQYTGASRALETVSAGDYGRAAQQAKQVQDYSSRVKSERDKEKQQFQEVDNIGKNLTSNVEGRIVWLEMLKTLNVIMPKDDRPLGGKGADEIAGHDILFISNLEAIGSDDLATWFQPLKEFKKYVPDTKELLEILSANAAEGAPGGKPNSTGEQGEGQPAKQPAIPRTLQERLELIAGPPPGTPGRVVQMVGYHYHNADRASADGFGGGYVRDTLIRNLKFGEVILPSSLKKQRTSQTARDNVAMRDLGIMYPTLMNIPKIVATEILNPRVVLQMYLEDRKKALETNRSGGGGFGGGFGNDGGGAGMGRRGQQDGGTVLMNQMINVFGQGDQGRNAGGAPSGRTETPEDYMKKIAEKIDAKDRLLLRRFDFVVQFGWVETPPSVRERIREEERQKQLASQVAAGEGGQPQLSSEDVISTQQDEEPQGDEMDEEIDEDTTTEGQSDSRDGRRTTETLPATTTAPSDDEAMPDQEQTNDETNPEDM